MNLLLSTVADMGYMAGWFRPHLGPGGTIVGTSNSHSTTGFSYCDRAVLMPDIVSDEYIPAVLELCRTEAIDLVLSFTDLDVVMLARHRDQIEGIGVRAVLPAGRVADICLDKVAVAAWLDDHGFQTEPVWSNPDAALGAIESGELRFPCLVKSRTGTGGRHQSRVLDEASLVSAMQVSRRPQTHVDADGMIAQNVASGIEYGMDVLNDLDGNVVSVVVKRKLRMVGGHTDRAVTVADPAILEVGERLARTLSHRGPLDVDLFVDGEDVCILDLNPRLTGGYDFSHAAGADFPRKICAMVRGETVAPDIGRYAVGLETVKESRAIPPRSTPVVDQRRPASPVNR